MPEKEIALIMPVHNNQDGLEKSLLSITDVENQLLDIIIIDDGSNRPVSIDNNKFSNIHLIRFDTNRHIVAALNAGLQYAFDNNYSYIARLDAGDMVVNNRFVKQLQFMKENKDVGIVGSHARAFDSNTNEDLFIIKKATSDKAIRNTMHLNNSFMHPAVMMRGDALKKIGFYNEEFCFAAQDYEYFFRILAVSKGANIDEVLLRYEVNNKSAISHHKRALQLKNRLLIQLKYFDFTNHYGYIGAIKTAITSILPYSVMHMIKMCIWKKNG